MESSSLLFSVPITFLLSTLIVIGVFKIFTILYRNYFYWKNRNVPYLNSLPFLGTAWKLFFRRISFVEYNNYAYNYYPNAKYVGMMEFTMPAVFLRDPELIRDVMVKDFEHFPNHRTFADEDVEPMFAKNVFFLKGDRWKNMRNTLSPTFTASKMKIMFNLVSKCSKDFVNYLIDYPELCAEMNTRDIFRRYTNDVIATTAFGINVNSMKDRNNEFYTRGVEVSNFSGFFTIIKMILFRLNPQLSKLIGLTLFSSDTVKFFNKIVQQSIKIRKEQGIIRPDMIHLLMQAQSKEGSSIHEMTLDDIVAQAFIFFLAGFDAASTLMCFLAHELAVNQDIQERLREEVEEHFAKGNGEITYESLSEMVYMDMVVSETLRKHPPTIFIDRVCAKNYELPPAQPGYNSTIVNTNFMLWISVIGLHHDPKYFPNPSKFDPERFSAQNKDKIIPYTYLPFGHGPRKCIGNRFALMETKILLAHLLRKFIFKPTEKTIEPIVFDKTQFNSQPVGGFWIGLEKRET